MTCEKYLAVTSETFGEESIWFHIWISLFGNGHTKSCKCLTNFNNTYEKTEHGYLIGN